MCTLENYLENLQQDCKITLFKASGPGGQHRNKTESAVRLQHLPTGIIVTASESRSQRTNRKLAWMRMIQQLHDRFAEQKPRITTSPPLRSKENRLRAKKKRSLLKNARKKPDQDLDDQALFVSAQYAPEKRSLSLKQYPELAERGMYFGEMRRCSR